MKATPARTSAARGRERPVMTLEEARDFVRREQRCTILTSKIPGMRSLWDAVGLPDKKKGEKGWGRKMEAVWAWKTELPARYPDEIFYGKIPGGTAVLMTIEYLRAQHYPQHHRDLQECSRLAQKVYELVRLDVYETGPLRKKCLDELGCSRAAFDKALNELQVTMNIVRSNDPKAVRDTWLPFSELYFDLTRTGAA